MVLARESVGHLFSGFEGGVRPSKMSVSDGDGDSTVESEAGGSAIVAYEATRRGKNECYCYSGEKRVF